MVVWAGDGKKTAENCEQIENDDNDEVNGLFSQYVFSSIRIERADWIYRNTHWDVCFIFGFLRIERFQARKKWYIIGTFHFKPIEVEWFIQIQFKESSDVLSAPSKTLTSQIYLLWENWLISSHHWIYLLGRRRFDWNRFRTPICAIEIRFG